MDILYFSTVSLDTAENLICYLWWTLYYKAIYLSILYRHPATILHYLFIF